MLFPFNAALSSLHGSLEDWQLMIIGICNFGNLRNLGRGLQSIPNSVRGARGKKVERGFHLLTTSGTLRCAPQRVYCLVIAYFAASGLAISSDHQKRPSNCTPRFTWSPNGVTLPLTAMHYTDPFFMHHIVCNRRHIS